MDQSNTTGPPARRPGVRMIDLFVAIGLLVGWVVLQVWVLPALGVRT